MTTYRSGPSEPVLRRTVSALLGALVYPDLKPGNVPHQVEQNVVDKEPELPKLKTDLFQTFRELIRTAF